MNLWVKQIGLVFGLALFIFACEEPGEIGLNLQPGSEDFVLSSIDIPLESGVGIMAPYYMRDYYNDYLVTTNTVVIGKYSDGTFGSFELEGYLEPNLFNRKLKLKESAVLDTVELRLYLDNFYGYRYNVTGPQTISVYELADSLDGTSAYDKEYDKLPDPIAEIVFELDTVVATKFISVDLPLVFGKKLFDAARNDTLVSEDVRKIFNGLAFVPGPENDMLFRINLQSFLVYDYREEASFPKDSAKSFVVNFVDESVVNNNLRTTYDIAYHLTQVLPSESVLNGIEKGGALKYDTDSIYLHPLLGSYGEIDFTPILKLRDSLGHMVINKAIFSISDIPYDSTKRYLSQIDAFEKDEDFDFRYISIFQGNSVTNYDLGDNIKFNMKNLVNSKDKKQTYLVSEVVRTPYTPNDRRTPLFEDYIQSIVSDPKYRELDELKIILAPGGLGGAVAPLVFDKDNFRLKIYFSYFDPQAELQ